MCSREFITISRQNGVRETRGFHNVHSFLLHPTTLFGWHPLPRIASGSGAKNALYEDAKLIVGNPLSVLLNAEEMKHWYGNTPIALMQFLFPSVSPLSYKLSSQWCAERERVKKRFLISYCSFLYVLLKPFIYPRQPFPPQKRFI